MILRRYPDSISSLNKNCIVHFSTNRSEVDNHVSPLSIKCLMKGFENYRTNSGSYKVTSGSYLIVNEGQECKSSINEEAETFSVYFNSAFANEALRTIVTPSDQLLNVSFLPTSQPVHFFEKLYSHNHILSPEIMKLRIASKVNFDDENWMSEQFYSLLEKLLEIHRELHREIEKLPPIKFSTKAELYKRVCRAKEFIDDSFEKPLTLEIISREAYLSQFHFLRLFKTIFKQTPHQYLTKKRIEKARMLLSKTDMPVTEVCLEIGFESPGSFSWMFRKKFGLSPEMFRVQFQRYMKKS